MRRLLLLGPNLVLLAGCEGGQKAAPAPQVPPGVVITPPDSPKLAQIRVEQIKMEKAPITRM